jgi:hypothetical protein
MVIYPPLHYVKASALKTCCRGCEVLAFDVKPYVHRVGAGQELTLMITAKGPMYYGDPHQFTCSLKRDGKNPNSKDYNTFKYVM